MSVAKTFTTPDDAITPFGIEEPQETTDPSVLSAT